MDPLSCYHFEPDEEGQLDCRCIYVMPSVISYNGAIILQLVQMITIGAIKINIESKRTVVSMGSSSTRGFC